MAAPTFVTESESAWNTTTTPKTSGSLSVTTGDVLLDCIADENFTNAENYNTSNSGTAQTWTEYGPALTNNADASCHIHTAVSTVTASMTVTATRAAGDAGDWWGHNVLQYTDSDGIGNTANSASAQSVSITVSADSSIVAIVTDWSAASWGTTRAWATVGGVSAVEMSYFNSGADYTLGVARWENVPAGTYTVGMTGLGGSGLSCQVVEVLGSSGGTTVNGVATGSFGGTFTASGVPATFGAAVVALGFTASAQGVDRALGVAATSFGFTGTAAGVDRAVGAALATFGGTFAASGTTSTPPVTGQASGSFGFTAAAAGIPRTSGQASASFGFAASASGATGATGQASASFGFVASALGVDRVVGVAVVIYGFAGTSTGVRGARGAASGSFGGTFSASGFAGTPPVTGQASASFGGTFAAAGVDRVVGLASALLGGTFTAAGIDRARGQAATSFGGTFAAAGAATRIVTGVASTSFGFVAVAIVFRAETPATRGLIVPAESRALLVGAESRVDQVPSTHSGSSRGLHA